MSALKHVPVERGLELGAVLEYAATVNEHTYSTIAWPAGRAKALPFRSRSCAH